MRAGSPFDLRSLEIFLAASDAGGISAAARTLGLSQSAVSQQISRLEKLLDLKLIERDTRVFRLLPAGRTFHHHARQILREVEATERAMQEFRGLKFPSLSVRIMDSLSATLTNEIAKALYGTADRMQISAAAVRETRQDFLNGKTDILVTSLEFDFQEFEVHHIATEALVLITPKGTVAGQDFELNDLANMLPFVRYTDQRYLAGLADRYLARQMVTLGRSIEVDQATAVIHTVRQGRAWAITSPFSLLDPGFREMEVDVLSLPKPAPTRPINLVIRPGALSEVAGALAARCREHLRLQMQAHLQGILPIEALPSIAR